MILYIYVIIMKQKQDVQ